ncbi:hypothetical protein CHUAL_012306 [Chamberlinius hualienensis]
MQSNEFHHCEKSGSVKISNDLFDSGLVEDICGSGNDLSDDSLLTLRRQCVDFQLDSCGSTSDSGFGVEEFEDQFKRLSVSVEKTSGENSRNQTRSQENLLQLRKAEAVAKYCRRNFEKKSPRSRLQIIDESFAPDEDGDTRLHLAVVHSRLDIVLTLIYLIPHPSYLDHQNKLYQTALHLSVLMGQAVVVRRLVLAGARTTVRDWHGNTPLHLACERGELECIKELTRPITNAERKYLKLMNSDVYDNLTKISIPLNPDIYNYEGRTCVHIATLKQRTDILLWLKRFGADINAQDYKSGRTPLTYAVELRNSNLIGFLIQECHANVEIKNYAGYTPFQVAYGLDEKMAYQLQSLGAFPSYPRFCDSDSDLEVS